LSADPVVPQLDEVIPAEALEKYAEARRKRMGLGIPGHVDLRCDEGVPGQPAAWSVWIGGMRYWRAAKK
jgi:hypothetical protein